ncbi:two-component system response regulator [Desulfosarcina alkanivorans]|uniref:Two-component system response regulator n=1 Tax=Desulfosarcina alkanivorans TaxID=571177 RepID=A0A5K7YCF6_9BACT|nr:HD domain-containing phosphohydrolase [Desulfosarcina alkanivorans]BBO67112.1 two-component system response regulator [Desulfosarcina alkanivorans]
MDLKYDHTLLLVDDEPSILKALKRLFRREGYRILTAEGGQQALDLLQREREAVSLIISDQRMPAMNGAVFLERSMDICPRAIRFLLTGYSDMDAVVDAVNQGNIHKYLSKPWNDAEILLLAREALYQVELKLENRRLTQLTGRQNRKLADLNRRLEETVNERTWALKYQNKMLQNMNIGLEKSLMGTIRLLVSLVASSNPGLGSYMKATAHVARGIAVEAGLDEDAQNRVEMAGLVHDIGLLGMPETLLEKDERSMSAEEFDAYRQHPEIAALSLSSVEGLKAISEIVGAHHENLDGSGFPNGIMGGDLPTGARILAVAADYCAVLHLWPKGVKRLLYAARRYLSHDAVSAVEIADGPEMRREVAERMIIAGAGKRYDGTIVRHFLASIGSDPGKNNIYQLAFNLLKEGMVLMEDLRLQDGRLLLTRGTTLGDGAVQSIQSIGHRGMIDGAIAVTMPSPGNAEKEDRP